MRSQKIDMPVLTSQAFTPVPPLDKKVRFDFLLARPSLGLDGNRCVARHPNGATIGSSSRLALATHPRRDHPRPLIKCPG